MSLDELNDHFTSIPVIPPDNKTKQNILNDFSTSPPPKRDKFYFQGLLLLTWKSAKSIKSKTQGTDDVSIIMLNKIIDIILPTVTHIFNASLITSIFPRLWKRSIIRPRPKVNLPTNNNVYRPISILRTLSKALEDTVHKELTEYLHTYDLLDTYQSGFRTDHSKTTALLEVT